MRAGVLDDCSPPWSGEPVQNNTLVIDEHNIVADVLYLFLLIDFSALSYTAVG